MEVQRARCQVAERNRWAYALAHAAVRSVLSRYTGVAAWDLCFIEDDFGKPALAGWGSRLSFNLSRTEGLAVLALTAGRRIGVDVERIGLGHRGCLGASAAGGYGRPRILSEAPDPL